MSEMSGKVINLQYEEIHQQEMSCKVVKQNNDENKRNEEEKNDIEKEEDYKDVKNAIVLNVEKMLTRNRVIQKVCMKLLK